MTTTITYKVTVHWAYGSKDYYFEYFMDALEAIQELKSKMPDLRVNLKTERRDCPQWLQEIFTGI